MFTEKHHPEQLSRVSLDYYLERGWYRMGQGIFTCHFLCFGEQIYSAIWLRLDLKTYTFRKSLRRLLNRNKNFRVVIRPATLDKEKEALYQKYRWFCFRGNISTSLQESLLDGGQTNIYNTMESCVYDGEQLVAASFFDIGERSIASILGMYDPDYSQYSLGFYTMLLEVQYGMNNNFDYYYPGYIVPGYPRFDYKTRIGDVNYYDLATGGWLPFKNIRPSDYPLQRLKHCLLDLQKYLTFYGIKSQLYFYPLFETHLITYWEASYLKHPVFLWCPTNDGASDYLVIVYDLMRQRYILLQCALFSDLPSFLEEIFDTSNDEYPSFLEVLLVKQTIVVNSSAEKLAQSLLRLRRVRRWK